MKETEEKKEVSGRRDAIGERSRRKRRSNRDWETASFAGLMFALARYRDRLKEERGFKLSTRAREIDVRIIDQNYGHWCLSH